MKSINTTFSSQQPRNAQISQLTTKSSAFTEQSLFLKEPLEMLLIMTEFVSFLKEIIIKS